MNVDFNNLRKQALITFDELTKSLNAAIITESGKQYAKPNDSRYETDLQGYIVIDSDDILVKMRSLQSHISSIALCFEPSNEKFVNVYEQVFTENDNFTEFGIE